MKLIIKNSITGEVMKEEILEGYQLDIGSFINPTELTIDVEPVKKVSPYARLEKEQKYFCLGNYNGDTRDYTEKQDFIDNYNYITGNYFKSKEEAEASNINEVIKATAKVKNRIAELNDGWGPDWEDTDERRWFVYYDFTDNNMDYGNMWNNTHKQLEKWKYLKSEELAQQLIREMPEELELMLKQ